MLVELGADPQAPETGVRRNRMHARVPSCARDPRVKALLVHRCFTSTIGGVGGELRAAGVAMHERQEQLFEAAREGRVEAVRALVAQGETAVHAQLPSGATPLHAAAENGHGEIGRAHG